MKIKAELIPPEFMKEYDLTSKIKNGYVYMEIRKGMYGLPQAGILANDLLRKRLGESNYYETSTPGLWKHTTRPVTFTLVVDDFGIKYIDKQNVQHLINVLKKYHEIEIHWKGEKHIGITLKWDYTNKTVDTSMPNYVMSNLRKYGHKKPLRPQNAPFPAPPRFNKDQKPNKDDTTPLLN